MRCIPFRVDPRGRHEKVNAGDQAARPSSSTARDRCERGRATRGAAPRAVVHRNSSCQENFSLFLSYSELVFTRYALKIGEGRGPPARDRSTLGGAAAVRLPAPKTSTVGNTMMRFYHYLLPACMLTAVMPGALRAQAGSLEGVVAGQTPRWSVSLAGGIASDAALGVSRRIAGHGLLAVGYAPWRSPLEMRVDLMAVSWQDPVGQVSVNASGVLPVGRVGVGGSVVRPYLLAGVGAYGFGSGQSRKFAAHAGGGLRLEYARYAVFGELRRHAAYGETFLSLGATMRR